MCVSQPSWSSTALITSMPWGSSAWRDAGSDAVYHIKKHILFFVIDSQNRKRETS